MKTFCILFSHSFVLLYMDKFIFLDFDGVLTTARYHDMLCRCGRATTDRFGELFDPQAVANLRTILERSGAKLIITSSWRTEGLDIMRDLWHFRMLPGRIADITPFYLYGVFRHSSVEEPFAGFASGSRGMEIDEWLMRNAEPHTPYVILDDEEDILLRQADRFIKIDAAVGITSENARQAIELLESGN